MYGPLYQAPFRRISTAYRCSFIKKYHIFVKIYVFPLILVSVLYEILKCWQLCCTLFFYLHFSTWFSFCDLSEWCSLAWECMCVKKCKCVDVFFLLTLLLVCFCAIPIKIQFFLFTYSVECNNSYSLSKFFQKQFL